MKPELLGGIVAAIVAVAQLANVFMFYKIRVAQLESEKRVLDEVEQKYVRKDSCSYVPAPRPRHA
jgi:hypothetical protein